MSWFYLSVAIIAEVMATTALKASDGFSKLGPSAVVVIGYGLSFYMLSLTLRTIPVGIVYAVWSGVGIILITLIAWFLFGQKLDVPAMIGIGLIISGVIVLNAFSMAGKH
jgi:small multidrug resistance pump